MRPLEDALPVHASIALVGICKNAGKTTMLNALLSILDRWGVAAAITSARYDGEAVDVVAGMEKPGRQARRFPPSS